MKAWRKAVVVGVAMLGVGVLRLPLEAGLNRDLHRAGLLSPPMEIDTRDRIGQTSAVVALGGLRTLVATFLNLRAFTFFEMRRWDDVHATFCTVVDLAPHTGYYWESGAHHQAMNAAGYFLFDEQLDWPPLRREAAARAVVQRGRAFIERGIRNNPNDWRLYRFLGYLLTDRRKYRFFGDPDATFAAAAAAYRRAAECPEALPYLRRFELYALARVASRRVEALELARELHADPANHRPTLLSVLFALENELGSGGAGGAARAVELWGSAADAHRDLANYWLSGGARLPVGGVVVALQQLEAQLGIPEDQGVLRKRPQPSASDE